MTAAKHKLLVCNCEVSMALDGKRLCDALGQDQPIEVHTQLCRAQIERFKQAVSDGGPLLVGCTQEAPLFDETRAEFGQETPVGYVNLRERAGWSEESEAAGPKIAALIAEASLDIPATPSITMESHGQCLVYGGGQDALDAARQLASRLAVTLMLTEVDDALPPDRIDMPIFKGRVVKASGHLGSFQLTVDDFAPMTVSSKASFAFGQPRPGVEAQADLILDLSGGAPLFPADDKRDGYFRPDPGNPAAVQRALFDLTDMVGEFEKPIYVDFKADLCAHSRSQKTGCTRCLDVCPASAIQPDGDVVAIDPFLCGGCGGCNSVCPTGAAAYAYPPATAVLERLRTLLGTFWRAGGEAPVLLIHDDGHGLDLIGALARSGRGLPARVIPFALNEVTQLGLDAILAAFAYGAERVLFLIPKKRRDEISGLQQQCGHAEAILHGLGHGGDRHSLMIEDDPSAVEALLWGLEPLSPIAHGDFLPLGQKRSLLRAALDALYDHAPEKPTRIALADGAPFGRAVVDADGCTLCLACVGACPTGAMIDNPDLPQLRFQEDACVQCGLCESICPESVITLEPGVSFEQEAKQPTVIKEEEPFLCIRCQKPFGTKSSIEKIVAMLGEKHAMFQDSSAIDRIRMCEDCRVIVQFEVEGNPMAGPARTPVRTTDDYLRERDEIEAARRKVKDEGEDDAD
ncbi:MAG: 4Fe-4S binding protein [Alphaproteobacteria bacterium]|nr:4Fe-4S binding protein [Alphaproteobacteria bacterium]